MNWATRGLSDDGRRRALRQAARHGAGRAPGARARGADHRRGRLRSAASAPSSCSIWPRPACSTAACACARWCCPTPSSTTTSPSACTRAPASTQAHRRQGAGGDAADQPGRSGYRLIVRARGVALWRARWEGRRPRRCNRHALALSRHADWHGASQDEGRAGAGSGRSKKLRVFLPSGPNCFR